MATKAKTQSSARSKSGGKAKKAASARSSSSKAARSVKASKAASARSGRSAKAPKASKSSKSPKASRPAKASAGAPRASARSGGRARVNPEFMKPMQIREPLTRIVGSEPLPRTEVTKRVWDYIKQHNLQDQENRRQINADENLRELFGRDSVTMFEMTKIINQHLG